MKIAGLLHDCGKITTPVHVVDKATKLETIFDRIHLVSERFEILKRDAEIALLNARLSARAQGDIAAEHVAERDYQTRIQQLEDDRVFLRRTNIGGERMSAEDQARVEAIAGYRIRNEAGVEIPFLSADEKSNLNIPYGTLNPAERKIINHRILTVQRRCPSPEGGRCGPEKSELTKTWLCRSRRKSVFGNPTE